MDDNEICQVGVKRDCTVPGEAKRRVAREQVRKCNQSCISGVGVAQPWPELCLQDRSWPEMDWSWDWSWTRR
jgi:hypothetical protein